MNFLHLIIHLLKAIGLTANVVVTDKNQAVWLNHTARFLLLICLRELAVKQFFVKTVLSQKVGMCSFFNNGSVLHN